MKFLRIFQHLLPRSRAWRITIDKTLRSFFEGLAPSQEAARDQADIVYVELSPETTTHIGEWEKQFAIVPAATDAERRSILAATWQAQGGQDPAYIQNLLQIAGFDLYVHEWWSSGPPYVARDPRNWTTQPLTGTYQCAGDSFRFTGQPQCSDDDAQAQCNELLANDPGYLVNRDLTNRAPPPVPDDPDTWPYFLYISGATFGDVVDIPFDRKGDLERLLLKVCPTQQWIVLRVDYVGAGEAGEFTWDQSPGWANDVWT